MKKEEKIANIMCFMSILLGDDDQCFRKILEFTPDYIIEKFERYIVSPRIQYPWGLHPRLRKTCFNRYIDKWKLELADDERTQQNAPWSIEGIEEC